MIKNLLNIVIFMITVLITVGTTQFDALVKAFD